MPLIGAVTLNDMGYILDMLHTRGLHVMHVHRLVSDPYFLLDFLRHDCEISNLVVCTRLFHLEMCH